MIQIKRIYEEASPNDGYRILVDRLWPRGISKEKAKIDLWMKDISPSHELRKWFNHEADKWEETQRRYAVELEGKQEMIGQIRKLELEHGAVTLLFAARDVERNNARALQNYLKD